MKLSDPRVLKEFSRPLEVRLGNHRGPVDDAADAIRHRWPDIVPEASRTEARLILKRVATCHRLNEWHNVPVGDVLIAARTAYDTELIDDVRLAPFREFLIEEVFATSSVALLRVMFSVHLSSFKPKAAHTHGLARALSASRSRLGLAEKAIIQCAPEILDADEGPLRLAERLIKEPDPAQALKLWGLRESYDGGLMSHVYLSLIVCFKPLLRKDNSEILSRFFRWIRPDGAKPRQLGGGAAIDAVLEPWLSREPSAEYKADVISGLTATYGDPRIQLRAAWKEASDASQALFRRWLTGSTMMIFLDAISSTNDEEMWKPRRKFWMKLYKDGHIDEAWVAFNDEAYRAAQRMARNTQERELYAGFGKQTARRDTSLLVMRIGGRIIVEGSHSYKVQLFEPTNPKRPELYQRLYNCETIRLTSDEDKVHVDGSWQRWVMQRVL